jgi:hypothetical protein
MVAAHLWALVSPILFVGGIMLLFSRCALWGSGYLV